MVSLELKKELFHLLNKSVELKINTAQSMIDSAIESKNNETKSTAGDKYETGRAMMQAEQEKNEIQLNQAKRLQAILSTIHLNSIHQQIAIGSLVETDKNTYFISIGLGKVPHQDKTYFALSPGSPIGKLLIGKKVNDTFSFQGIERKILFVV